MPSDGSCARRVLQAQCQTLILVTVELSLHVSTYVNLVAALGGLRGWKGWVFGSSCMLEGGPGHPPLQLLQPPHAYVILPDGSRKGVEGVQQWPATARGCMRRCFAWAGDGPQRRQ